MKSRSAGVNDSPQRKKLSRAALSILVELGLIISALRLTDAKDFASVLKQVLWNRHIILSAFLCVVFNKLFASEDVTIDVSSV
jgi:hypothetical protein